MERSNIVISIRRIAEKGFTLFEVLVAAVVLGVIAVGAVQLYTTTFGVQHKVASEFDLRQAGMKVLDEMGRGFVRNDQSYTGVFGASAVQVSLDGTSLIVTGDNTSITYSWSGEALSRTIDEEPTEVQPLLTGVESFAVACVRDGESSGTLIKVELELVGQGSPEPRVSDYQLAAPHCATTVS